VVAEAVGDDVQIDLASMQEIGRLTTLTRLCLGGCSELVTDQGLKGVAPLTALTRLSLDAPPYSKLAVTDAGLVAARIPSLSLTHLDLRECAGVTLVHGELGSLTALTHLDLWGCYGVSDVGLRTLR
jgi:internalin A